MSVHAAKDWFVIAHWDQDADQRDPGFFACNVLSIKNAANDEMVEIRLDYKNRHIFKHNLSKYKKMDFKSLVEELENIRATDLVNNEGC